MPNIVSAPKSRRRVRRRHYRAKKGDGNLSTPLNARSKENAANVAHAVLTTFLWRLGKLGVVNVWQSVKRAAGAKRQ